MNKNEFVTAFTNKDTEKLKSFLLSEKNPVVIISPTLLGEGDGAIWVGDYLHMLFMDGVNGKNNIPLDCYKHIFQLEDLWGGNWLHYSGKQSTRSPKGILKLLISFVEQKVLTIHEALEIVFSTSSRHDSKPFGSLIVGDATQKLFHGTLILWMDSVKNEKGFDLIARQYLDLYSKYPISRQLSDYDRFLSLLVSFSSFDGLNERLGDFLFFEEDQALKASFFADLCVNAVGKKSSEDQLCILLYKVCRGSPHNIFRMIDRICPKKPEAGSINYLNILLNAAEKERVIPSALEVMMRDECPDWLKIIQVNQEGSVLYQLMLLMIKDALRKCKDDLTKQAISFIFFKLLFQVGPKPHFYFLSDLSDNASLWDLVFDIFKLCMSCDNFSLHWMLGLEVSYVSLLSSLQRVNPTILERFFALAFSRHNANVHMKSIIDGVRFEKSVDRIGECAAVLYTLFSVSTVLLNEFLRAISDGVPRSMLDELAVRHVSASKANSSIAGTNWQGSFDFRESGGLYRVLLLMIRDALRAGPLVMKAKISQSWMEAIFCQGRASHIYSMGQETMNDNSLIWDVVFEIFEVCKAEHLFDLIIFMEALGPDGFRRICLQWAVKPLSRFLEFMLDPALSVGVRGDFMEGVLLAVSDEDLVSKFRNSEELTAVMSKIISLAITTPGLSFVLIRQLKVLEELYPEATRRFIKMLLEKKFDSFLYDEKRALLTSKSLVSRYVIYKNDKKASDFSPLMWWSIVLDENKDSPLLDYLVLEACLQAADIADMPGVLSAFKWLMRDVNPLSRLRRCRHAFSSDEYCTLVKRVCDAKLTTTGSHFILFKIDPNGDPVGDRLEELRSMYDCPILINEGGAVKVHGFVNGRWRTTDLDSNEFSTLSTKWGAHAEPVIVSPGEGYLATKSLSAKWGAIVSLGDGLITDAMYQEIKIKQGHDFYAGDVSLLAEFASIVIDRGDDAVRSCLDSIPLYRRCLSAYMQNELVSISLRLYNKDKRYFDLVRAIRYASKLSVDEIKQYPVSKSLLQNQTQYFEQLKILKELFAWDEALDKYGDDGLYEAASNLQSVILNKLQQDNKLESELTAHVMRVSKWLTGEAVTGRSLTDDFAQYKTGARTKTAAMLNWITGVDILVAATEKLYEELARVKGVNQFVEEIPEVKESSAWSSITGWMNKK